MMAWLAHWQCAVLLIPALWTLSGCHQAKQEKLHDHLVTLLDQIATADAPALKRIILEVDDDAPPASTPATSQWRAAT